MAQNQKNLRFKDIEAQQNVSNSYKKIMCLNTKQRLKSRAAVANRESLISKSGANILEVICGHGKAIRSQRDIKYTLPQQSR